MARGVRCGPGRALPPWCVWHFWLSLSILAPEAPRVEEIAIGAAEMTGDPVIEIAFAQAMYGVVRG